MGYIEAEIAKLQYVKMNVRETQMREQTWLS